VGMSGRQPEMAPAMSALLPLAVASTALMSISDRIARR